MHIPGLNDFNEGTKNRRHSWNNWCCCRSLCLISEPHGVFSFHYHHSAHAIFDVCFLHWIHYHSVRTRLLDLELSTDNPLIRMISGARSRACTLLTGLKRTSLVSKVWVGNGLGNCYPWNAPIRTMVHLERKVKLLFDQEKKTWTSGSPFNTYHLISFFFSHSMHLNNCGPLLFSIHGAKSAVSDWWRI